MYNCDFLKMLIDFAFLISTVRLFIYTIFFSLFVLEGKCFIAEVEADLKS